MRFAQVQREIRNRGRRLNHVSAELFAEPAWDILLYVYSFALVGRRVTEKELAERIAVPMTTAIRRMNVLEADGLVERAVISADPPHVDIALTIKGLKALDDYFVESPDVHR